MSSTVYEELQGKEFYIKQLVLECENNEMTLTMKVEFDNKNLQLNFSNVSDFNLKNISFPSQISGFEVIDYKSNGWESAQRFKINDFEDGRISFYCAEISLND